MKTLSDVIIIGGGPAGVTASLYTARANLTTTLIYKDHGALEKAEKVDNYYGLKPTDGKTIVETGLEQARNVNVRIISAEVVGIIISDDGIITVETTTKTLKGKTAVFATGATRATPDIKGLTPLEGKGISYCAICDGFFYRGKDVAVLGSGAYALHEVNDLLPIVKSVTVLTNGHEPTVNFPENVKVIKEKITEITATKSMMGMVLSGVKLENDEALPLAGLFIAIGVAGGTELARKLGAILVDNAVQVDNTFRTSIPGIWAAGDCTGGLKQIAKAVYEGAQAGTDIVRYLRN